MRRSMSLLEGITAARLTAIAGLFVACGMAAPVGAQDLSLFDGTSVASIVYDKADGVPIAKAAALLAHDLTSLTGIGPVVTANSRNVKGSGVVIGRAAAPQMAAILKANGISTELIAGKWETYGRAVVPAPWDPERARCSSSAPTHVERSGASST